MADTYSPASIRLARGARDVAHVMPFDHAPGRACPGSLAALLEVLEDREVVGHFLVDALPMPLKMTLHCEDVITAVTVEQV